MTSGERETALNTALELVRRAERARIVLYLRDYEKCLARVMGRDSLGITALVTVANKIERGDHWK